MTKLNKRKIEWIIKEIEKQELSIWQIAKLQKITARRVRQLRESYRKTGKIPELKQAKRKEIVYDEEEVKIIKEAKQIYKLGATSLEMIVDKKYNRHIPHNRIHKILLKERLAKKEPAKSKRRKWVRFERKHSNSMWHTDWTQLENGNWLITFEDDASRKVISYGEFKEATTENSVSVLKKGIQKHEKPREILTGRDSQFYTSKAKGRRQGKTQFQLFLQEQGIKHIVGRVNHPQTNGKQERLFGTVKRHYNEFRSLDELINWYNDIRPNMSLDWDNLETPSQAFIRKMHYSNKNSLEVGLNERIEKF